MAKWKKNPTLELITTEQMEHISPEIHVFLIPYKIFKTIALILEFFLGFCVKSTNKQSPFIFLMVC